MPDFAELLARARKGDDHAFATLFRLTQPRLLRYLAITAGPAAEDVAADTWVSVIKDLDRFNGDELGDFHAWVTTIARRRWIDEVRRRTRRPEVVTADLPESPNDGFDAVDLVDGDDAAAAMLRSLPREQAEIIALRVVFDLDVAATAAIVGSTEGAVRVAAHRGLKRLAQTLQSAPATERPAGAIYE